MAANRFVRDYFQAPDFCWFGNQRTFTTLMLLVSYSRGKNADTLLSP